jgi:hypothetical protein
VGSCVITIKRRREGSIQNSNSAAAIRRSRSRGRPLRPVIPTHAPGKLADAATTYRFFHRSNFLTTRDRILVTVSMVDAAPARGDVHVRMQESPGECDGHLRGHTEFINGRLVN